ncbi:SanA/YdcF family protein [Adlercreutzia murintestinalis]|uniref:SanA/YdcF family protein n=1 Tax=Adlercreutzia murintestinalis TaxID=2941325 RepID=UPI0020405081|nr:YdcF family protein [Adlercreutzia murintestinalis]
MGRLVCKIAVTVLVLAIVAIAAAVGISTYVVDSTRDQVHTIAQIEEAGEHADAIVVLGASVYADGTPSDILADRLEVASDLYLSGAASTIIVSGDNTDAHYNESDAMKDYCVKLGVPAAAVEVDGNGYDTYASIWRARNVYGAQSIIVVTQAYHLYRALAIANGLGLQAWGVPADKGDYDNQAAYSIRENMARVKDFFQTLLGVPPSDVDSS